jgi:hypothetical protein
MSKPLIFIHIPKTAGTSLRSMMATDLLQKGILSVPPYKKEYMVDCYQDLLQPPFVVGMRHLYDYENKIMNTPDEFDFKWSVTHMVNKELWDYWVNYVKDKSQNRLVEVHLNRCKPDSEPYIYDYTKSVISDLLTNESYKDFNWMAMLRNPVDRVISEFYFMKILYKKNGYENYNSGVKQYWGHLFDENEIKNITLDDYIDIDEVSDTQTKMLMGGGFLGKHEITKESYEMLLHTLSELKFKIGIQDKMSEIINLFNHSFCFDMDKNKQYHFKKNEYKSEVTEKLKEKIKKKNKWDNLLYKHFYGELIG